MSHVETSGQAEPKADFAGDAFKTFSILWGIASLIHQVSFSEWLRSIYGPIVLVCALFFLFKPSSLFRFALLLASEITYVWGIAPYHANHILFTALVDLTMLLALGRAFFRRKLDTDIAAAAYRLFAPVVRLEFLLLYFFAVLHKLNTSFFHLEEGCPVQLTKGIVERFPFLPFPDWSRPIPIWATLAFEAAIPLCLCFRASRKAGILMGLGFHLLLALHPHKGIYSFTTLMFTLYFLFTPPAFSNALRTVLSRAIAQVRAWRRASLSLLLGVIGGLVFAAFQFGEGLSDVIFGLWFLCALCFLCLYWVARSQHRMEEPGPGTMFRPPFAPMMAIPCLLFFNGINPYLGLKTETSFAMFSNLRTEKGLANHLFLPQSLKIADYQDDLVYILRSSDPRLQGYANERLLLPYFELRRQVSQIETDFSVTFQRRGQTLSLTKSLQPDNELFSPPPWLLRKLLRFRPVDSQGPQQCRH